MFEFLLPLLAGGGQSAMGAMSAAPSAMSSVAGVPPVDPMAPQIGVNPTEANPMAPNAAPNIGNNEFFKRLFPNAGQPATGNTMDGFTPGMEVPMNHPIQQASISPSSPLPFFAQSPQNGALTNYRPPTPAATAPRPSPSPAAPGLPMQLPSAVRPGQAATAFANSGAVDAMRNPSPAAQDFMSTFRSIFDQAKAANESGGNPWLAIAQAASGGGNGQFGQPNSPVNNIQQMLGGNFNNNSPMGALFGLFQNGFGGQGGPPEGPTGIY